MNNEFLLLAFNVSNWNPSEEEWDSCIKKLNDEVERKRIMNFKRPNPNYNKDQPHLQPQWLTGRINDSAKSSMAGRLLIIELTKSMLTITDESSIRFNRTESNKPYLLGDNKNYNFNISHDTDWVVSLGSLNLPIGIDIMNSKIPRRQTANEFFGTMSSCFTDKEWKVIKDENNSEKIKTDLFFIHWCLKESYIKADGKGLEIELKSLEFEINQNNQTAQLYINKKKMNNYQFTYFKSFLNHNNRNDNNDNNYKEDNDDILAICVDVSKINDQYINNIITKDNLQVKILNSDFKINK
ncbi:hypothetical protein DICPUDRAFT_148072 [Dictyostelium purpureum]|uniref:holo-[acyl-carrier-protein] synthase n=1 Tax=Dictyostelium purpureum TaxID=5786 RepID=F0ZA60_DICPU|nr:uncharacterized protein DICPUDRAFT_148072 [Dictyostelium purpureum]EGC39180.1 hypothetical protein DICPUDRAFT_148072 [Dictyostelium purpureum]|eukprot:XP_003284326.1 hypothetical protein DICPUDRAFT_148072 [Dictyostelium purpureum]